MKIKNKLESIQKIKELKLNQFEEELFHEGEELRIQEFLDRYPYQYYAVRSKSKVGHIKSKINVPKEEVIEFSKNFDIFSINVSSSNFLNHLLLNGDIMISSNGDVWMIAYKNEDYSGREDENLPDFNLKTDLFDKILNEIPGFDILYKYIVEHGLLDIILECAVYDIPLGIYHDQVVLFEIRTDF